MRRLASVVSLMVLVAAACAPAAQPSTSTVTTATVVSTPVVSTTTTTTTERTTAPTSTTGPTTKVYVPPEVGPLAGLSWPGGRVPVGALLHDDGTRLWSITLDGERTAIWEHPAVEPLALAAGPDGARVAMSVLLPAQSTHDWASVLYVLEEDGTVRVADAVSRFFSLESPMFIRPPTETFEPPPCPPGTCELPPGYTPKPADPPPPVRLYWLRLEEMVFSSTGRLDTRVMVETDSGPAEVTVPLRHHEAVFGFDSYPGAATFSVTLFRQNDVPTRLEILQNLDYAGTATDASLLLWSDNESRANTDIFDGVAWLTPNLYVIPVAHEFYLNKYSLRLFKDSCEYLGSHVVYEGTDIGRGYADYPWPLLSGGPDQVLVVSAKDEQALLDGQATDVPWTAIDIHTGTLSHVGARYELGTWTWVAPQDDTIPATEPPDCTAWEWTWP